MNLLQCGKVIKLLTSQIVTFSFNICYLPSRHFIILTYGSQRLTWNHPELQQIEIAIQRCEGETFPLTTALLLTRMDRYCIDTLQKWASFTNNWPIQTIYHLIFQILPFRLWQCCFRSQAIKPILVNTACENP